MQRVVTNHSKTNSRRIMVGASPLLALASLALLGGCGLYDFGDIIDGSHGSHGSHGSAGSGSGGASGGDVCEFDGGTFLPGEAFPSTDGCNECVCSEGGGVACTERACLNICGGLLGASCPDGQYCSFPPEAQCGAGDQTGICAVQPEVCTFQYDPVCGCDGTTYGNACSAASAGISVVSGGECGSDPGKLQLGDSCGGFRRAGSPDCDDGLFCQFQAGAICGAADAPGECVAIPELCPDIFAPVCGCDGETYSNACDAAAHLAGILDVGACD